MLELIKLEQTTAETLMKKILGILISSFLLISCSSQQTGKDKLLSPEETRERLAESAKEGKISIYKAGKVDHGYNGFSACFEHIPNLITGEQFNELLNKGANLKGNIEPAQTSYFESLIAADPSNIAQTAGAVICTYSPASISKKSTKDLGMILNKNQSELNQNYQDFLEDRLPRVEEAKNRNEKIKSHNQELINVDNGGIPSPGQQ